MTKKFSLKMIKKNKLIREHRLPEYELNNKFDVIIAPPEEVIPKQTFKDKVIEEFNRSINNFKNDLYFFKPKEKNIFLKSEISEQEKEKRDKLNNLMRQSIEQTSKLKKPTKLEKIKNYFKSEINQLNENEEIESSEPKLTSQQEKQFKSLLQKTITQTNTYRKKTLIDKVKDEISTGISNYKTNMTPLKLVKQYFNNRQILKKNGLIIPFSQKLKNEFKYLIPAKKLEREDLTHYKALEENTHVLNFRLVPDKIVEDKTIDKSNYIPHRQIKESLLTFKPLWKRAVFPIAASVALATAIYFTPDVKNTQNIKPQSFQTTEKISPLQKSNSAIKIPAANFAIKKAQITQKDKITYSVKKGDTFSEIVKQYVGKSGSELYADINEIKKLNPKLIKNPDLIKPNQKIVLEIKDKLVDKEYKVKIINGQKTYFNLDETKLSPDLEKQIILYEAKQELKNNTPKIPKNNYTSIDSVVDNYNSIAGLFRKSKNEKDKAYIANILDFARESGKTIQATNTYIENSKDSESIKETIRKNYLYNTKSELDEILANKFEGLDTTKVKFTSIIDEKYGKGVIRKRSNEQKKKSEFMRESELLYKNLGQGKSEKIKIYKEK